MNIQLSKPIVFFDLETTGLSKTNDRIVEIAMTKINPDKSREDFYSRVNPGIEIPKVASDIHGILNSDLENEPDFKSISNEVFEFIKGCDLGGFNIHRFDVPFLFEEFGRCGIMLNTRSIDIVDPFVIIRKMEKRDLGSLYERYTGKTLDDAHSAGADNLATIEIFEKQIEMYDLPDSVREIHLKSFEDLGRVDLDGKFIIDNDKKSILFNFGKYSSKTIQEVYDEDQSYFDWIIEKSSMSTETKMYAKQFKNKLSSKQVST